MPTLNPHIIDMFDSLENMLCGKMAWHEKTVRIKIRHCLNQLDKQEKHDLCHFFLDNHHDICIPLIDSFISAFTEHNGGMITRDIADLIIRSKLKHYVP